MSPTLGTTNSPLTAAALRDIASQEGPSITLLIPDHHPGAHEPSRAALVRGMARLAAEQVAAQKLDTANLLEPIEDYASALKTDEGGPGIALFRTASFLAALSVRGIRESSVTLSRHFNLSPLMAAASAPQEFYILGLSRKNLGFYHYLRGQCEAAQLPVGAPGNMESALAFDQPDHRLSNQSASGNSTGSMHAAPFGTTTERESAGDHLLHYFQLVDRGLKGFLKETPLLLAGVHEEVAAYRRASHNHHLLKTEIHGNIDFLTPAEIAERAAAAALAHYHQTGEAVLEKYREMPKRKLTRGTVRPALIAALAGRVHQLCVAEGAVVRGSLKRHGGFEKEDLVNAAIVETLRHGGEVFMLPPSSMPEDTPVAAILRF